MQFAGEFLIYLGVVAGIIVIHECGHFLAGAIGGIPPRDMRIRLLTFPQHVALRNGDRWLSPMEFLPYLETMQRHLPTAGRLYLYTAGGLLTETLLTTVICSSLLALGYREPAGIIASFSLLVFMIAVFPMDLLPSRVKGHPCGDVTGLWAVAKAPTVVLIVGMLTIRVVLIWLAIPGSAAGK